MAETYFHLSLLSRNLIALDATCIKSSINNNFMKDEIAMIITLNTQEEALKFEEDAKIIAKREKWQERFLMKIVVYVSLILIYDATISLFFCRCHVSRKQREQCFILITQRFVDRTKTQQKLLFAHN